MYTLIPFYLHIYRILPKLSNMNFYETSLEFFIEQAFGDF